MTTAGEHRGFEDVVEDLLEMDDKMPLNFKVGEIALKKNLENLNALTQEKLAGVNLVRYDGELDRVEADIAIFESG